MKKITAHFIKLIFGILIMFNLIACDEGGDPNPGETALVEVAGDWVVEVLRNGEHYSDAHISTYNTSDNVTTQMWLDDNVEGWGLKAKVDLNLGNKTFSGTNLPELYFDVTVTITDGEIITNGATAPSGTVVDSINFTAVFSDVPDDIWTYTGYKRTGFLEDE